MPNDFVYCFIMITFAYMEIYFIRHTSVDVPPGTCYGNTDVKVRDTFEHEAAECKLQLQNLADGLTFDAVYTSPLARARMLAAYCGFPGAKVDMHVIEFNFGEWEMCNYDELMHNDPRFAPWLKNFVEQRAPGGECVNDLMLRVMAFINLLIDRRQDKVAVFCHGGVLAMALVILGEIDMKEAFSKVPPYGSVIKIKI